jgi:pimeloyl-ACP methyl ester carboxylesterase
MYQSARVDMSNILALSGWGQPHDALSIVAPTATHIDFARHNNASEALAEIATHSCDIVIGWSLGGQLAVRAIASGKLRPRKLVLIATPFQFVKSSELPIGMPQDLFSKFRHNYHNNPERTLGKSWELIHKDDQKSDIVKSHLAAHNKIALLQKNWLYWLDELENFSCNTLHLADFPETILIHGDADLVVYPEQSRAFSRSIPHARLISISQCNHAPHWHDTDQVRKAIYG